MERGLIWLPLLGVFLALVTAGWYEYQKLEAYQFWSQQFQKSKYDIYAVIGLNNDRITWGKPTRKGPEKLQDFSLTEVSEIRLLVNGISVSFDSPPQGGGFLGLEFIFKDNSPSIRIPFTQVSLAVEWGKYLQKQLH